MRWRKEAEPPIVYLAATKEDGRIRAGRTKRGPVPALRPMILSYGCRSFFLAAALWGHTATPPHNVGR